PLVKDAHPSRPLALVPGRSLAGLCPGLVPSLRDLVVVRAGSTIGPFIATSLGSAAKISCIAGPSLEHAETEVRAIAALHRGDVAAPPDSSASRLLDALGNSDAVHLAMHLRHRDNPMFTELVCIDGAVRLHELQAVGAMPRLVILAVCEGGRALAAGGAAPADALLALGVECVVSSVLDVDDGASAGLMPALHASLRRGASVAAALRDLRCADEPSALAAACFDTRGADLHLA
ncbi:MAG: CHAT domain-containing protein, partial [Actinomycetota bacterium]